MREVVALVEHYLREWGSDGWADAYHSLIELGPRVLPELEARLETSSDAALRVALLEVARHMHSHKALAIFTHGLKDESPAVWKGALDGLVDLANVEAVALLEQAAGGGAWVRTSPRVTGSLSSAIGPSGGPFDSEPWALRRWRWVLLAAPLGRVV